jgi:EAL domain-containing protein (putative c-di-GMP-specific phosphodiesterase class I)
MRWQVLGMAPVRVAVNVSARQLHRHGFLERCLEYLDCWRGRTATCGLDLEVTESALLQDIDNARSVLPALRAAGVRVVLNDFGVGDASLGLLTKVSVDALKIDRSVIRGLPEDSRCRALASASIAVARSFGLDTVAVGLEKPAQLDLLRDLGCGAWQGYLHGRPATARALEGLLASLGGAR